ncbi:Putative protein phosphatase 2C-type [Stieleria neptunia]|uniref:PPM-type phosphatase domain-containing protein n=1 Tax=Stieleria neptunia TaxID=2527979 RepID=A0A518HLF7_9BACT|nr:protein phosphatase 2C domain-containing protein [Stieleria neptunia]QDV41677.1 Putative protein phosphatase 2C-type [Stieleria neptunia]
MPTSIFQRHLATKSADKNAGVDDCSFELAIRSAGASVRGGRDYNEDRFYRSDRAQFYLVADGMGGHLGGAMASQIAMETIPMVWQSRIRQNTLSYSGIRSAYGDALSSATREMSAAVSDHPEYDRMGCTLAVAFVYCGRMYFGHVGDCRIYLLHRNKLTRLTKDETLVQGLIDAGAIDAHQARVHRWRHIVTNSVSPQGLQQPSRLRSAQIDMGDRVMLTSDGLTDELADDEIRQIMASCFDPQECVDQLIRAALDRNARDNVSCVVFQT